MIDVLGYEIYQDVTVYDVLFVIFVMSLATVVAKIVTTNIRRALIDKMKRDQLEPILKTIYFGIKLLQHLLQFYHLSVSTYPVCWLLEE